MAISTRITENADHWLAKVAAEIKQELVVAADPYIQEALRCAERDMRKAVTDWAATTVENRLDMNMLSQTLELRLYLGDLKKKPLRED